MCPNVLKSNICWLVVVLCQLLSTWLLQKNILSPLHKHAHTACSVLISKLFSLQGAPPKKCDLFGDFELDFLSFFADVFELKVKAIVARYINQSSHCMNQGRFLPRALCGLLSTQVICCWELLFYLDLKSKYMQEVSVRIIYSFIVDSNL